MIFFSRSFIRTSYMVGRAEVRKFAPELNVVVVTSALIWLARYAECKGEVKRNLALKQRF